jgi:hypothetical protein
VATQPLHPKTRQKILDLAGKINPETERLFSHRDIAKIVGCSRGTVGNVIHDYTQLQSQKTIPYHPPSPDTDGLPVPVGSESETPLPLPVEFDRSTHNFDRPGWWGILSDVHIPCHDPPVLRLFVSECRRRGAAGVLLNGDILDFYRVSEHLRDPSAMALRREIDAGRQFLDWLQGQIHNADIIYRDGNHEERLKHYIFRHAPELDGLDEITLSGLMRFKDRKIKYVTDRRLIKIGKLPIIHGHEYKYGIAAPVNPARGLYLRAKQSAMVSHHHQVSTHTERTLEGKPIATWSLGCACNLKPDYAPFNNWSHGFAFVDVSRDGEYHVENLKVHNGKIL